MARRLWTRPKRGGFHKFNVTNAIFNESNSLLWWLGLGFPDHREESKDCNNIPLNEAFPATIWTINAIMLAVENRRLELGEWELETRPLGHYERGMTIGETAATGKHQRINLKEM